MFMKSLLSLAILSSVVLNTGAVENYSIVPDLPPYTFDDDCALYSIDIGEDWHLFGMNTNPRTFYKFSSTRYESNHLQFQSDVQHALLRYDSGNTYCYICRVVMSPVSKTRYWGFAGIGSYGDDWYFRSVEISAQFPSYFTIGDWSPKNIPVTTTETMTVGFSVGLTDIGANISSTIDVTRGLSIESYTNVATNTFGTKYTYPSQDNYSHNSLVYYTYCKFSSNGYSVNSSTFPTLNFSFKYVGKHYYSSNGVTTTASSNPLI